MGLKHYLIQFNFDGSPGTYRCWAKDEASARYMFDMYEMGIEITSIEVIE